MTKKITKNMLKFLLLIFIPLSSGCGQSTATDTPTLTLVPSQTPTPNPTSTPEPIRLNGILIYSDYQTLRSFDFQKQEFKALSNTNLVQYDAVIANNFVYFLRGTENTIPGTAGFGPSELFRTNLDGTDLEQLTSDGHWEFQLKASPNSEYLAYFADWEGQSNRYKMIVYDTKNNTSQIIAENYKNRYSFPAWSNDSKQLLFFVGSNSESNAHLLLYTLENQALRELLAERIVSTTGLAWSPDNKTVVFSMVENKESSIYLLNIEQGDIDKIATFSESIRYLAWSSSIDFILFELRSQDNAVKLCVLDIRNKKVTVVQEGELDGKFLNYKALWSPDGEYFAYFTNPNNSKWILNVKSMNDLVQAFEIEIPGNINSATWIYTQ